MNVNAADRFSGTFDGTGSWHDSAGKSLGYRIKQSNVATEDGFEVTFRHDFEDDTVVDATLTMTWIAPHLFNVALAGSAVGNGYIFDSYCHYHLKVGEGFVEASYRLTGDGLIVFGSSTQNAEGNYIAWQETLRRRS